MFDLVDNAVSIQLIREFHDAGKIITALCHGTAAVLNVRLADGTLLVAGQKVTGFSDQEEIDVNRAKDMPFHLEDALDRASGGHYEKASKAWDPKVVVNPGGKLLMGQNPASAQGLAVELLKVLVGTA
jgi:putative intracellular protease/amidase